MSGAARAAGPAVDVVVVNWNTAAAAVRAARAYAASEGVEARVTVVDNASAEGDRRRLLELQPPIRLVLSQRNMGYAAAANAGLRGGGGELVCVSNADVLPAADMLAELAGAVLADPTVGVAGPVYDSADASYHSRFPSRWSLLVRPFVGAAGRPWVMPPTRSGVARVDQPAGACLVARREVWERAGGFDEGYFLWYEDVDLARRVHDLGHRNVVVSAARAGHQGARAWTQMAERERQRIRLDSLERYIRRHHRRLLPLALGPLALARLTRIKLLRGRGSARFRPDGVEGGSPGGPSGAPEAR